MNWANLGDEPIRFPRRPDRAGDDAPPLKPPLGFEYLRELRLTEADPVGARQHALIMAASRLAAERARAERIIDMLVMSMAPSLEPYLPPREPRQTTAFHTLFGSRFDIVRPQPKPELRLRLHGLPPSFGTRLMLQAKRTTMTLRERICRDH